MSALEKSYVEVAGRRMAYHARGEGRPILFLHGNVASSYLWRNVLPEVEGLGRLIAPDLIGMGDSDKLRDVDAFTYSFASHRAFLWAFIDAVVGEEPATLVLHDWGSALGFEWAMRHPDRVAGIAYMEAAVRANPSWDDLPEALRGILQHVRTKAGEALILDQNVFVEQILPGSVLRNLTAEEMQEYRRPYPTPLDRWPLLSWLRDIPVAGEPANIALMIGDYSEWLSKSEIPKLFINAEPGAILTGAACDCCRTWPNQDEVTVPGIHYIQEDSGPEIGRAIASWLKTAL